MAFKLPTFGKDKSKTPPAKPASPAVKPAPAKPASEPGALPLIGRLRVAQQLQILVLALAAVALITGFIVFVDYRAATHGTLYVSAAGEMRMLSQRISKAAQTALLGNAPAFRQLTEAREKFVQSLTLLTQGGESAGTALPPTSDAVMPVLDALNREWEKNERNLQLVIGQQKNLSGLATAVRSINSANPTLLELAEQIQAARLAANAPAREISALAQLVTLTQRLGRGANTLLGAESVDADIVAAMSRDAASFRSLLQQIADSARAAARDADTTDKLGKLESAYKEFQTALDGILANGQALVNAKNAGRKVVDDSEGLLKATETLVSAYQQELAGRSANFAAMGVLALLGALVIWLMVKAYTDEQRRQAIAARREREQEQNRNRANQDAILRLMNEMQTLAEGDLTTKATVSEEITGAIADSVNYTIEELRDLVGRINDAATRVTGATETARATSGQLLGAAEYQSREIRGTTAAMLEMVREMTEMSGSTGQSASVARQSLAAAQKGQSAVQDSIAGMNDIREQIQETSKRIKRLGESSQEIGEIVELISDITEQTNVLALNAAIQAAAAGEAGRGFSVVAEEVQRLAERSGEATKQIAAIVKTIQTDTGDAVAAMERSTRGVVDGARLSDAAGQALGEIGEVSQRLASLIDTVSATAKEQAKNAGTVAGNMQDILRITQQTTEGTKKTSASVDELAKLATELKGSVSRFRV